MLAIVYGVKKFHQYLYGRAFTIHTYHRPLQYIFQETGLVPTMASARIQLWALTLEAYNYTIFYKRGSENRNADLLSKLTVPESPLTVPRPGELVLLLEHLQHTPVTASQIKAWTAGDPVLATGMTRVLSGWTWTEDEVLQPFWRRKDELSVEDGCLLWGNRLVISEVARQKVLDELHDGHPGVCRMKGIARGACWWPGIDAAIEERVRSCPICQLNQNAPAVAPLHPWEWPTQPWIRVHVDFAGPFMGKLFLF